jgi:hypothetical protein
MVYFKTKNNSLGKFWSVLQWQMLVNVEAIWSILLPFGIFYGHLVHFVAFRVYISRFGLYVVPRKIWQPCFRRKCFGRKNLLGTKVAAWYT